MKKVPTIFERDWDGDRSRVIDVPNPACEWIFAGEGWATRKLDGTCCAVREGKLYKRREVKKGKPLPDNFDLVEEDEKTGKRVGWVPVGDGPEDKYHREAFGPGVGFEDGTYELIGPKVQGNPERIVKDSSHVLWRHSDVGLVIEDPCPPRDFDGLRGWLDGTDIEGVVFHHPDGRMGKIKLRDFGLKRSS